MAATRVTVETEDNMILNGSDDDAETMKPVEESRVDEEEETNAVSSVSGIADVIAKILQKPVPKKENIILAQGQTDKQIKKRKRVKRLQNASDDGGLGKKSDKKKKLKKDSDSDFTDDSDEETFTKSKLQLQKRKEWENMCRTKPNILDKDSERSLQKIATRGVVQMFNAVRQQQSLVGEKLWQAGPSIRRREKVMSSITKKNFLDLLDKTGSRAKSQKQTDMKEDCGSWNILRDDYMMGAKMKDWDKDSDDGVGDMDHNM